MTDLFSYQPPPSVAFEGESYNASLDHKRLRGQLERVYALMSDGKWRTLPEISEDAGGSEASVSARLRDLRKETYGGHLIQRERVKGGLWRYRLLVHRTTVPASASSGQAAAENAS